MKREELEQLVAADFPHGRVLNWADDGQMSDVGFNVVPLAGGRFTIFENDGRGGTFQPIGLDEQPLTFDTEDQVCDYIWSRLNRSRNPAPLPPADKLAKQQRQAKDDYERQLAGLPLRDID